MQQEMEDIIIHQKDDDKWYFWDEVWAHEYGPYNSREACIVALDAYCESL